MKTSFKKKRVGIALGLVCAISVISSTVNWVGSSVDSQIEPSVPGLSSTKQLESNYRQWANAYSQSNPKGPVLSLMWTRGLSTENSQAKGFAQFNLENNSLSVRVKGLQDAETAELWLIDNVPGKNRSVKPEFGDVMQKIGKLQSDGDNAWLDIDVADLKHISFDMIALVREGETPASRQSQSILFGTLSYYQKLFHYPERQNNAVAKKGNFELVNSAQALGVTPEGFYEGIDSDLINRGRDLFFNETFDGNGRTCGTCHKEDDNMALSIRTISELPDSDPLFIVEQETRADGSDNPLYNDYRMEKPELMRKLGLIFENLNGFRELDGSITSRGVMRAPSHVLSVRTTVAPPPAVAFDDGTLPIDVDDITFDERTGWGGDGTPTGYHQDFFESNGRDLTGSLRDFTIGGIIQHFPLTIERSGSDIDENGNVREPDFRFATEDELDAMEAFMLSIGRQTEFDDLDTYSLIDEVADRGRLNYMGVNVFDPDPDDGRPAMSCNSCHFNGGANTDPTFPFVEAVTPNHDLDDIAAAGGSIPSHNRSFGPQVERLIDQAGDIIVQVSDHPSVDGNCYNEGYFESPLLPGDVEGVESEGCDANVFDNGYLFGFDDANSDLRIATNRFNVQPAFESMDNPPFFHGHQINTIEGAVAFYATQRHVRNGELLPAIIPLNAAQVVNVSRFMRVMGADFNAEMAITLLEKATDLRRNNRATNVALALAEIEDAIQLLDPVDLHLEDALPAFEEIRDDLDDNNLRRRQINNIIEDIQDAQNAMIVRGPDSTDPFAFSADSLPDVALNNTASDIIEADETQTSSSRELRGRARR